MEATKRRIRDVDDVGVRDAQFGVWLKTTPFVLSLLNEKDFQHLIKRESSY